MPNPFTPAIRLLNRLGYSKKFAVMGMLALLAIGLLLVNLYRGLHQVIEHSQRELDGLGLIKPITRAVWHAQIHRGLSSGVLNGETEMEPERTARQGEVERTLGEVAGFLKPELLASDLWKGILDAWTSLRDEGLDWIPRENFLAHTRLIQDLLRLQGIAADEYGLRNDPDIASAYLIDMAIHESPRALEHMGQLRALGTGALTRGQPLVLSQQIEFTVLLTGLNSAVQGLDQKLDNMVRHAPELKGLLENPIQDMVAAAERITTLVNQDILSGVQATSPADYFKLTTESLERGYQELFGNLFPTLERLLGARIERARWDLATGIAIAALGILIYVYMSVGLYQATLGTVRRLVQHARRIATGDLGAHIELDTRDELKHLADSLNDMVTAFRALIQSVHLNAVQVLEAAQHLSASTGHIRDGGAQQSDAASSMAAAVEEMTTGIGHLAHNAQDAHRISGHAGDLSAEGGRVVSQVIQEIQRIAEVVNQSATIITELDGRSERISAIVNVIKGIADQTNLLALNAAIEAARAGESGRGFAVVAEEVRNLAERTGRSTQEISAMIDAIQQGTRHAAGSMRLGVSRVNEGVALATRAGQALDQIGGNVRQVVARVAEISHALGEQSGASHEIARNIEHIARMAEQNRGDVAENAVTATQLERLSTGLEAEVRRFRLA